MSAYDSWLESPVQDAIAHTESFNDFIAITCERLWHDDDVLADGLTDALYDPRTRNTIIALVRAGDMLAAMKLMHDHATTTYITEAAEVAAEKEFYQ